MQKLFFVLLSCSFINFSSLKIVAHKQETVTTDDGNQTQSSPSDQTNNSSEDQTVTNTNSNTSDSDEHTNSDTHTDNDTHTNSQSPEIQKVKKLFPALGYDLKQGPLWSVICLTKSWGRIPGKLDLDGHAFYTYDYSIYYCDKFFKVNGRLVWNEGKVPDNCYARGKQNDNSKPLFNVIAVTQYGNIPGKASSPIEATFSVEAIRHSTKTFYWIC